MSKFEKSASISLLSSSIFKIPTRIVPFSSEVPLCSLIFRPIFILDRVFFFPYTLSIKKQVLIKRKA